MNLQSKLSVLFLIHIQSCSTEVCAKEFKAFDQLDSVEPAWAQKIPKDRYPCFCDPPPATYNEQRVTRYRFESSLVDVITPSTYESIAIMNILRSKLKQTTTGLNFSDQLCCEVKYRVTDENRLVGFVVRNLSEDKPFNAAVFHAIYLVCNHEAPQTAEKKTSQREYRFFFTPKDVFLEDPYPDQANQRKALGPLRIQETKGSSEMMRTLGRGFKKPQNDHNYDIKKFLNGDSNRFDGYDSVPY